MNNLYIFLTNSIRNVGGSQLYIANKTNWLESIGWEVQTLFYNDGRIIIDRLKKFEANRYPFLSLDISISTSKDRNTLLSKFKSKKYDKIIVESHEVGLCFWGEFLAKELGGMNICYPLSENFNKIDSQRREYFLCKLKDNLLWGIDKGSIPMLLGSNPETENRQLLAVGCTENNFSNEDFPLPQLLRGQTILCLSRLDKPFIMPMMYSIKSFVLSNKNKLYNLLLIGDAAQQKILHSVLDIVDGIDNLKVVNTGYINPIPRNLFEHADVAIASAGCVVVTSEAGLLTIAIDAYDHKPMGIYGVSTTNTLFRENEPILEIPDLLDDILNKKKYDPNEIKTKRCTFSTIDYTEHYKLIEEYDSSKSYTVKFKLSFKELIKRFIYILFGKSGLDYIGDVLMKYWFTK